LKLRKAREMTDLENETDKRGKAVCCKGRVKLVK